MKHRTSLLLLVAAALSTAAGIGLAQQPSMDRPQASSPGATDDNSTDARTPDARHPGAAQMPDARHDSRGREGHWLPLRRYAPDDEPWDPSYQMDPRIGRHQRANAPN